MARGGSRGRMRGMYPPPAIFNYVFDVYYFSVISSLFDSDKLYALSTHDRKCAKNMRHMWQRTQNRVKKFKPENYSKRTK